MSGRVDDLRSGRSIHRRALSRIFSRLFGGRPRNEVTSTRVTFAASPKTIWNRIVFYEEVPGRAPLLLRLFMPHPLQTEGEKTAVGVRVRCLYEAGELIKRITSLEAPHRIHFDVVEQHLGIENCVVAQGGSYEIDRNGKGSDVLLTTKYKAYLHPRWLWRPLEKLIAGQLHRHVLNGMREVQDHSKEVLVSLDGLAIRNTDQV
jgi:hypothetical protein